jgi:hypothetical protein
MTRFDVITTDVMHSENFVKEIGYPGMIKESVGDTISDNKIINPIKRTIIGSSL